jgi:hypothetical protein
MAKVDYEKDVNKWVREGANKVNRATSTKEKLRNMPEAAAKTAVGMVARPAAAAASGVVNTYKAVTKNQKTPSVYSKRDDKPKKPVSPAPMRTVDDSMRHYKGK